MHYEFIFYHIVFTCVFQVHGAYPGYMIYFRPMSLSRSIEARKNKTQANIAPPKDQLDVVVKINGKKVKINSVQAVKEFAGKTNMTGYLIHTELGPKSDKSVDLFKIIATDKANGDKGEAIYYHKERDYVKK